jgi:hypothetical protein
MARLSEAPIFNAAETITGLSGSGDLVSSSQKPAQREGQRERERGRVTRGPCARVPDESLDEGPPATRRRQLTPLEAHWPSPVGRPRGPAIARGVPRPPHPPHLPREQAGTQVGPTRWGGRKRLARRRTRFAAGSRSRSASEIPRSFERDDDCYALLISARGLRAPRTRRRRVGVVGGGGESAATNDDPSAIAASRKRNRVRVIERRSALRLPLVGRRDERARSWNTGLISPCTSPSASEITPGRPQDPDRVSLSEIL